MKSIKSDTIIKSENGGRALILFLLFAIALFTFYVSGITGFALVCLLPLLALCTMLTFKHSMFLFGVLFFVNYFVSFASHYNLLFLPISAHNEILEIMLIAIAIINSKNVKFSNLRNLMGAGVLLWVVFCLLELFNDSCGIGLSVSRWYTGARLMSFQIFYAFVVCSLYISSTKAVKQFITMLAICVLFAVLWTAKQKFIGFDSHEKAFFEYAKRTHLIYGIIRYFSIFTDAANFGIHMAACSVLFFILGVTAKIKKYKIFFLATGILCAWAMFTSGTRTAIFCFIAGTVAYIFISKSFKIAIPVTILFALFIFFLAFTRYGQGNHMIRRMRSAFNRSDASLAVRDSNKESLRKYVNDAPWGIGIGVYDDDIPKNNKYYIVSQIAPDSEYVFIWVRTGIIGLTIFLISNALMVLGACWIVLFRIKSPSLRGIGAAFICAFLSIQVGAYANQILMQYPNILVFYGGLTVVFVLPKIENEYTEYENRLLAGRKKKKQINLAESSAAEM